MADMRGETSTGKPRNVRVDNAGRLVTNSRVTGLSEFGDETQVGATLSGALQTARRYVQTPFVRVPQPAAGVAYGDEDAFGTKFVIDVPKSGTVVTALAIDQDDEDINVDLMLFNDDFTSGTDNDPFAPSLSTILKYAGNVTLSTRKGVSGLTVTVNPNIQLAYSAPKGKLWVQAIARGAINMAAGTNYYVALVIAE